MSPPADPAERRGAGGAFDLGGRRIFLTGASTGMCRALGVVLADGGRLGR